MRYYKIILLITLLGLLFSACNKNENGLMGMNNQPTNLTKQVEGNYIGTLTNSVDNTTKNARADISSIDNYTIQVHCYSEDMDTTFLLDLYPNGNKMMVCNNGDDFVSEYGHIQNNSHDMMQNNDCMDWNEHMESDHELGDEHYGAFDMDNNNFDYTFRINSGTNNYTNYFSGLKK